MSYGQAIKGLAGGRNPAKLGRRVIRVGAFADLDGVETVDLFRVSGGEVMITNMYGIVTTLIAALCTMGPVHTPTVGGVETDMAAISASIDTDVVNSVYTWDGTITGQIAPTGIGIGTPFDTNYQILVDGVIGLQVGVVATAGAIDWILNYIPLDPNAFVNAI